MRLAGRVVCTVMRMCRCAVYFSFRGKTKDAMGDGVSKGVVGAWGSGRDVWWV